MKPEVNVGGLGKKNPSDLHLKGVRDALVKLDPEKARDAAKQMACATRWLGEMLLPLSGAGRRPSNKKEHRGANYFRTIGDAADEIKKSHALMQHFMEVGWCGVF